MIFPEIVPQIQHLGFRPEKAWVDHNLNQEFEPKDLSEFELWEDLQKALELLDLTCPEASDWVRDQHNNGNIIYDWEYDYTMARFDFLSRKLTLTSGFYQLREGEKATTLAHEYRHSIQNRTKFIKRIIFQLLTGKTHEYVVEDDADLFESRLYIALHG